MKAEGSKFASEHSRPRRPARPPEPGPPGASTREPGGQALEPLPPGASSPYTCPRCGRVFVRTRNFQKHLAVCDGENRGMPRHAWRRSLAARASGRAAVLGARAMLVGGHVRGMRRQLGLTREELAARCGWNSSEIGRLENGSSLLLARVFDLFEQLGLEISVRLAGDNPLPGEIETRAPVEPGWHQKRTAR